jgi:MoxR-like ATPase
MRKLDTLRAELERSVIGRKSEFDLMIIAMIQQGHVLLESVPGSGKTLMAKSFAGAIAGQFRRMQFTPDVLPSDVTGIRFFNPRDQDFVLRIGPIQTNILLADEINRATPRTQSSLLEAMEEKQVTIDGETVKLPEPFMVIATQNPVESQQGTFPLPAAQLDRFLFRIEIGYPDLGEEKKILADFGKNPGKVMTDSIVSLEDVMRWSNEVKEIAVHDDIQTYIVHIVRATREHHSIEIGLSSRAALAILQAAQGMAFLEGRNFTNPDDVKAVLPHIAGHRLVLTPEGMLTREVGEVLEEIVSSVPAPVEAVMK